MQIINRIFWKNARMGFENRKIRELFLPLYLQLSKASKPGDCIWVKYQPLTKAGKPDDSLVGFVRAKITEVRFQKEQTIIAYDGFYGKGEASVHKNGTEWELYCFRNDGGKKTPEEIEGSLVSLAESSPHATIPMAGY
jgi:hypothetical protein